MKLLRNIPVGTWVSVASVGCLAVYGAVAYRHMLDGGSPALSTPVSAEVETAKDPPVVSQEPTRVSDSVAMRYARSVQSRDCEEVVRMTFWMQERIKFAMLSGQPRETVERELCLDLQDIKRENNVLASEGVEDKYLFATDTTLQSQGEDAGRKDLEDAPAAVREWIKVTYSNPLTALKDGQGKPIRSITVGVNVSQEGYILKAGIVGNLDIGRNSISYDWPN
ncbi:MAG: hypothetical protein AMXMBFR84_39600 [Candidatus Hydrogenedentota bacterium]